MLIQYPLQVVLVDDQEDILEIMETFLEDDQDLKVTKFDSPLSAMEFIENNTVNIVITDIKMKEMAGDDLLRKILNLEKGVDVVVTSGKHNMTELMASFKAGAFAYISKPFTQNQLITVIDRAKKRVGHWNSTYQKIINSKKK